MGACLGTNNRHVVTSQPSSEETSSNVYHRDGSSLAKNVPLRHEKIRWKSDLPLTESQVLCKRDEFWDTAPAFEGRKEIWDALKAAASGVENHDYDLAQAIIDGANITLPNGTLTDCYDELGNRYQLPVYCLSYPINIILSSVDRSDDDSLEQGEEVVLKIRLSTNNKDVKLSVHTTDTVATAKKLLEVQEGLRLVRQRWYYSGKLLSDRQRIGDCGITPGYIVQCIINDISFVNSLS